MRVVFMFQRISYNYQTTKTTRRPEYIKYRYRHPEILTTNVQNTRTKDSHFQVGNLIHNIFGNNKPTILSIALSGGTLSNLSMSI